MKDQPPRARKPDRRVSIRDVAEHCRLSTATVSLVLNGQGQRFTPQTQARVRQSVEELGYRPNVLARGLRTNRTRTIGVVADQIITTPYATSMIEGVQEACWERGYLPFVVGTDGDPQRTAEAMDALVGRQVEGILVGAMYHKRVPLEPTMRGLVAVGMNVRPESGDAPSFVPDELGAAEAAVRTLVECDHQRIVHITEPPNGGLARGLRVQGYEQAMASAGLGTAALVVETEPDEEFSDGAERISHQLLDRRPATDGVLHLQRQDGGRDLPDGSPAQARHPTRPVCHRFRRPGHGRDRAAADAHHHGAAPLRDGSPGSHRPARRDRGGGLSSGDARRRRPAVPTRAPRIRWRSWPIATSSANRESAQPPAHGRHKPVTATPNDVDRVRALGADEVIDFTRADFTDVVSGYDVVLDSLGPASLENSLTVLEPCGLAIGVVGPPDPGLRRAARPTPPGVRTRSAQERRRAWTRIPQPPQDVPAS